MKIVAVDGNVFKVCNILDKIVAYIKWDAKCAQYILFPQFETNYTSNDLEVIQIKLRELNGL